MRGPLCSIVSSTIPVSLLYRNVVDVNRRLRGVPLKARSADVQKIDEYDDALKLITGNPKEALSRIQKNPAYATGLNSLVGSYIKSKA
nr:hypothetical protein [uncultured archaeon]